jgi:energy-coupling factor transporter ATP-binding protein EcfA2
LRARDNPFAVHRVLAERYRLDEDGWTRLDARLAALDNRGAIVGPHGSGKTTLLEDLAERLERRGERVVMLRFTSTERQSRANDGVILSEAKDLQFVLVDGAEQLSRFDWLRLRFSARSARGLVITSHRDGMLPLLQRCHTSPALLAELVHSLGQSMSSVESAALHARHRGNLREAIRELYDLVGR